MILKGHIIKSKIVNSGVPWFFVKTGLLKAPYHFLSNYHAAFLH